MLITRYNASGNTFVIFHTDKKANYSDLAIKLCGQENVDGLIVVVPHNDYDFEWLFYNNDGSTANMCGNGTRAVAHYAFNNNLTDETVDFLTGAGQISCKVDENIVETTMTKPKIIKDSFIEDEYKWILIDTGVPHLVTIVDDLEKFDLDLCSKMRYKYNANVNFAKINKDVLNVRTYERGVEDETKACGTGMTACFIYALEQKLISSKADVYPLSNELLILTKENDTVYFKGEVTEEYTKEVACI